MNPNNPPILMKTTLTLAKIPATRSSHGVFTLPLLTAAAIFVWSGTAIAEMEWGGGSGDWSDSKWGAPGGPYTSPWVIDESPTFIGTAGTVTHTGEIATGSLGIGFDTSGYVLSGGSFLMSGTLINAVNTDTAIITINSEIKSTNVTPGTIALSKGAKGVVILNGTNTYVGVTQISAGALRAIDGTGLPATSLLQFNNGVLETSGTFARTIGTADGNVYWNNAGGFSAYGAPLTATLNGGAKIDWAAVTASGGFNAKNLIFGSFASANNVVTLTNDLDLKGNRTVTVNDNTSSTEDSAVLSGIIANGDATARTLIKAGTGTLVLANAANTYTGATAISASGGTLVAPTLADGDNDSSIGKSSNAATNLLLGNNTTLKYTGGEISINRGFTMNATTAAQVFTLDASGTGAINFTNTAAPAFEASSTRVHTLNLSGTNVGDNILAANVANAGGTGFTSLSKSGTGTWILTGASVYTGATSVNLGTLKLSAGAGASLSGSSGLTFGGTAGFAGGTFAYDSTGASADLSQGMGALVSTQSLAADSTLQVIGNGSHNTTLTFSSVTANASENGNTINFAVSGTGAINGTNTKIVFTGGSGTTTAATYNYAAITSQTAYFNGGDFAVYDTTGYVRGINYGTDTNSTEFNGTAITGTGTTTNAKITASITDQGTATLGTATAGTNGTLLIPGSFDITQTGGTTLTLAGAGNAGTYGILKTGGTLATPSASTISGGTIAFVSGAQTDIRVDTAYDTLTISSTLTNASNVRLMKSGAGTLILSGGNLTFPAFSQFINGGMLEFGGSGTFTFAGAAGSFVIAPGALFSYNSTSTTSSIARPIAGSGGVNVNAGTLTLTAANTYTGATTVSAGTLALVGGSQKSPITVSGGAFLDFTLGSTTTSTSTVTFSAGAKVKITGIPSSPTNYTLLTAAAISGTPTLDPAITGYSLVVDGNTLKLNAGGGGGGYATWATANASSEAANLDFDNDGLTNGVEYFMNITTPGFTANPAIDGTHTVTWPNGGNIPSSAYGSQFTVQTSSDLESWSDVPATGDDNLSNTDSAVSYTLTGTAPRFVRLMVTPN
jgi:fibronectin-binding autotransporter adhesin